MIEIELRCRGGEYCNSYIVGNQGEDCFIIDDGYDKDGYLTDYALTKHPRILGILLTHGHFDHIGGLIDRFPSCPVFLSDEDEVCLRDPYYNGSMDLLGRKVVLEQELVPYPVEDEDEIRLGQYVIKAIATPFHTMGSVCYYLESEGVLFSGDTLFYRGIGRYDLKGAAPRFIQSSLSKLFALPDQTIVYPGHGGKTTVRIERSFQGF